MNGGRRVREDNSWTCVVCKKMNDFKIKFCYNCSERRPKNYELIIEGVNRNGEKTGELKDEKGHKIVGRGACRGYTYVEKINPDTGKVYATSDITGREFVMSDQIKKTINHTEKTGWQCLRLITAKRDGLNYSCKHYNFEWRATCEKCGSFKPVAQVNFANNKTR